MAYFQLHSWLYMDSDNNNWRGQDQAASGGQHYRTDSNWRGQHYNWTIYDFLFSTLFN